MSGRGRETLTTFVAPIYLFVNHQVRLTFCNMRQNIHDRKRRRGGPGRKKSTDQRRPSTAEVATAVASVASEADSATPIPVGETIRLPVPRNFEPLAASSTCSPMPCLSEVEEQLSPKEVEDECISKSDLEDATAAVDSRDEAHRKNSSNYLTNSNSLFLFIHVPFLKFPFLLISDQ